MLSKNNKETEIFQQGSLLYLQPTEFLPDLSTYLVCHDYVNTMQANDHFINQEAMRHAMTSGTDIVNALKAARHPLQRPTAGDYWQIRGNELIRVHKIVRSSTFAPKEKLPTPAPLHLLEDDRSTHLPHLNGKNRNIKDNWRTTGTLVADGPKWIGEAKFKIKAEYFKDR